MCVGFRESILAAGIRLGFGSMLPGQESEKFVRVRKSRIHGGSLSFLCYHGSEQGEGGTYLQEHEHVW